MTDYQQIADAVTEVSPGTAGWTNPTNILVDGAPGAAVIMSTNTSMTLDLTFDFASEADIDDADLFDGFEIEFGQVIWTSNEAVWINVQIKDATGAIGENKAAAEPALPSSSTDVIFGSSTDSHGMKGITGAQLKAAAFGVYMQVECRSGVSAVAINDCYFTATGVHTVGGITSRHMFRRQAAFQGFISP